MESRNPLSLILSLLVLVGAVVVVGLMFGGVLGTDPDPGEEPVAGLEGGSENAPPAAEGKGEPLESPEAEKTAREAITPVEEAPGPVIYALRDPDDRALAKVDFALYQPGRLLLAGETDARGRIELSAGEEGLASLLVLAPSSAPQILEVSLEAGRHEVQLERRSVVSGWIVVDGHEPEERIELTLDSDRSFLDDVPALEELELDHKVASRIEDVTDDAGAFLIYGLAADWSGRLRVPGRYRLKDRSLAVDSWFTTIALERPIEGLFVELTRSLRILGRVVEIEGGEPVAAARIYPKLVYADGSKNRQWLDDVRAGNDGRFEVVLESPHLLGESLRICPPSHQVERAIQIEAADLVEDLDLGDIPLRVPRGRLELAVLVQDRVGAPIQGAVATTLDARSRPSEPTGEEGRTVLTGLAEGPAMIRVLAVGCEIEEVPAFVGPEGGELIVTMRRGTLLRLRFLAPDGTVMRRVRCALTTGEYPFEQEITWPVESLFHELGTSLHSRIVRGGGVTLNFSQVRESERVIVSGMRPGLPLQLLVVSGFNTILVERELAPLSPEEHRDVDVVLDRAPRTLRVQLLDEEGEPLTRGSVGISYRGLDLSYHGLQGLSRSDVDNALFEFAEIFTDSVALHASCDGYIPFQDPEFPVPPDELPVELRLEPGREALVIIEDTEGRAVSGAVTASLPSGAVAVSRAIKTGQYLLEGLPDAPVTVTFWRTREGGGTNDYHSRELGADETELRIVLPVGGRVEGKVTMPQDIDPEDRYTVNLVPEAEGLSQGSFWIDPKVPGVSDFFFEDVCPGEYTLVLRRLDLSRIPEIVYEELGSTSRIEVEPERTVRIELRP